jgi:hypothetical protein
MGIDPMNNISNNNKNTLCSYIILTDDLFLTSTKSLIVEFKYALAFEFEMDLGMMHYFLGLEVWQRNDEIFLS